jgi:glucose/arabinose dehydrogenase
MARKIHWDRIIAVTALAVVAVGAGATLLLTKDEPTQQSGLAVPGGKLEELREPRLKTEDLTTGFSNIWDMVFLDNETILFNERSGNLRAINTSNKEAWQVGTVPNVRAEGEGGLLGLAMDTEFATNRYLYACYNASGSKRAVKVTRFKLAEDKKSASGFTDIITDIQSQGGRHSGCRLAMDRTGVLWVGTGDSAIGTAPMDKRSLAGKILRVDRDGKAVSGNAGNGFDARIYNYGHRNIQGLVLLRTPLDNGAIGLTSEHGPDVQDEINWLKPGNFGWDPVPGTYNESVPMTDKKKYPDAIDAVWNSGTSTIATSGITVLTSERWSLWRGWLAVAALRGQQVRLLQISNEGTVASEKKILDTFGRVRTVVEAPGGDLYLATDNGGGNDKIVRVIPE